VKENDLHTIFEQTDCPSRQDMLTYLEGEFSRDEQYQFEKHLNSCSLCRDEFEGLLALKDPKKLPAIVSELNLRLDKYIHHSLKKPFLKRYNILRIAAVALILISSGFFINYYLQYSSREFSNQEMVSQSIEESVSDKAEIMAEDSFSKPVTKKIKPEVDMKNELSKEKDRNDLAKNRDKLSSGDKGGNMIALTDDAADIESDEDFTGIVSNDKIKTKEEPSLVAKSLGEGASGDKRIITEELVAEETVFEKEEEISYDEISSRTEKKQDDQINRAKVLSNKKSKTEGHVIVSYLQTGIDAFHVGNYSEAIESLKKSEKYEGKTDKTTYYLGLSYSRIGNSKKALSHLNKLVNNPINEYQNEAMWEKAILLIRIGKRKSAINVLNDLLKTDSPYKKDAQHKLDSLLTD